MEPVADRAAAMLASHSQKEPSLQVGTHALQQSLLTELACSAARCTDAMTTGRQGAAHVFSVVCASAAAASSTCSSRDVSHLVHLPISTIHFVIAGAGVHTAWWMRRQRRAPCRLQNSDLCTCMLLESIIEQKLKPFALQA